MFLLCFIFYLSVLIICLSTNLLSEGSAETARVGNIQHNVEGLTMSFQTNLRLNDPCEEPNSQQAYLGSIVPLDRRVFDMFRPLILCRRIMD